MKTLFLDTATASLVIGLLNKDQEYLMIKDALRDHSTNTVEDIKEFLSQHQVRIKDIDNIVVGIGPGSYTGIRVAVMVAKMLASTLKIKLYKISSITFLTSGLAKTLGFIELKNMAGFLSLNHYGQQLSTDTYKSLEELNTKQYQDKLLIQKESIKISLVNSLKNAKLVKDIHSLVPNYARITQAEGQLL